MSSNIYMVNELQFTLTESQRSEAKRAFWGLSEGYDEQMARKIIHLFSNLPLVQADTSPLSHTKEYPVGGYEVSRMVSEGFPYAEIICFDGMWGMRQSEPPPCFALIYDAASHEPRRLFRIEWQRDNTLLLLTRVTMRYARSPLTRFFIQIFSKISAWLVHNVPEGSEWHQWYGRFVPMDPDMSNDERIQIADNIPCFYAYEDVRNSLVINRSDREVEKVRFFFESR